MPRAHLRTLPVPSQFPRDPMTKQPSCIIRSNSSTSQLTGRLLRITALMTESAGPPGPPIPMQPYADNGRLAQPSHSTCRPQWSGP